MTDRMQILNDLQSRYPASYCPECGAPNKCAIELGKSASTCWCMTMEVDNKPEVDYTACLCKKCLTKEN